MSPLETLPTPVVYLGAVLGALAALVCGLIGVIMLAVEIHDWQHDRDCRRRFTQHNRQDQGTAPVALAAQGDGIAMIERALRPSTDCAGQPFDYAAWLKQWETNS
jgi:hypothetical protein